MKHQHISIENRTFRSLVMVIGSTCLFVDSLSENFIASLLIVFSVQCGGVDKIQRRSPISLKHVCVRCLLFDPRLTPHRPNVHV